MAWMKLGTFVAAWNRGGYCWVNISPSSVLEYLGRLLLVVLVVRGLYKKVISSPVLGWTNGGRNVASE